MEWSYALSKYLYNLEQFLLCTPLLHDSNSVFSVTYEQESVGFNFRLENDYQW